MSVLLADEAVLDGGGEPVWIDVAATCPLASAGRGGEVKVYDGQVGHRLIRTDAWRRATTNDFGPGRDVGRVFQVGAPRLAFASVEEGGDALTGGRSPGSRSVHHSIECPRHGYPHAASPVSTVREVYKHFLNPSESRGKRATWQEAAAS